MGHVSCCVWGGTPAGWQCDSAGADDGCSGGAKGPVHLVTCLYEMCRLGRCLCGLCVSHGFCGVAVSWVAAMDGSTSALRVLFELQELPMGNTCISSWGGGDDVPRRGCAARVMVGARTFRVGW